MPDGARPRGATVVVGARGFIGRRVAPALRAAGHEVVAFVRPADGDGRDDEVAVDLDDPAAVDAALRAVDARIVCHLFWTGHPRSSGVDYGDQLRRNLLPTTSLALACGTSDVEHLVHVSTGGGIVREAAPARRPPAYGWAKRVAESTCAATAHDFGYALTTLRPSAVFGPGQDPDKGLGAVTVFLARLLRGEALHVYGDPGQSRDYLHVDDLADCIVRVIDDRVEGTFEVGGPESVRVDELVALLEAVLERRAELVVDAATGLDPVAVQLDDRPIAEATGWTPKRTLRDSLPEIAADVARRTGLADRLPPSLR